MDGSPGKDPRGDFQLLPARVGAGAQHRLVYRDFAQGRQRLDVVFFSSRRRHTILQGDWSLDVCSSDLSTPEEWEQISRLLQQLDVPPRQILVEAKIIEVTLTGDLQYGVQSYLQAKG